MQKPTLIAFVGALAFAQPALAQDEPPESEIIEQLGDPEFQEGMATMITGFLSAMMQVPIGQVVHAVEGAIPEDMRGEDEMVNIDPDATLGDLAQQEDPEFEDKMNERIQQGTASIGILASEFGALLPQLGALADRMRERMEQRD